VKAINILALEVDLNLVSSMLPVIANPTVVFLLAKKSKPAFMF
jgi:hypothetical protein